jgi:hypothetical protein
MSLKFFSILVLIFFIGCSTTPVKYDRPTKVDDYKYFVRLKDKKDDSVSKKTIGETLKGAFTTTPKAKTNKVQIKKSTPFNRKPPKRRIRKTNTNSVSNKPGELMSMNTPPVSEPPRDVAKTIMLYLIYIQALIIAIFAYTIFWKQRKVKKVVTKTRELNL